MVIMILLSSSLTAARPPDVPAHGVDPETFVTLWSGDQDTHSPTTPAEAASSPAALAELAAVTDIPFETPPEAAEQWNRGDHAEFPISTQTTSIQPRDVAVEDGVFIRDAYAAVFAIQPSTRLWQSPTAQPLYVGPAGEVLGTVDYRVAVPVDDRAGNRRTDWTLHDHRIEEVRLRVDGETVDSVAGTKIPVLHFDSLDESPGTTHTVTLEATIVVELSKEVTIDEGYCEPTERKAETATESAPPTGNNPSPTVATSTVPEPLASTATRAETEQCGTTSKTVVTTPSERLTVAESIPVVTYTPEFSGAYAQYPDGTQAVAISGEQPWQGYRTGETEASGVWQFYTARETRWDELVISRAGTVSTRLSPLRPLQVYAYPSRSGVSTQNGARPDAGELHDPPRLPDTIDVDVVTDPYWERSTVITEPQRPVSGPLTVHGLVRGSVFTLSQDSLSETMVHPSTLRLSQTETTAETVTVQVQLMDARTGAPVHTEPRNGSIRIQGSTIETDESGIATVTIPRPTGALTARYDPGPWWATEQAYLQSSDTVYIRGTDIPITETLFQLAIPIGSFLAAVFLIDRVTGWHLWPPWRGL